MESYTYPEHFDIGTYQRLRRLNTELLKMFRKIGAQVDEHTERKSECEHFGHCSGPMNEYYHTSVKEAQDALNVSIGLARGLLAEIHAIGGQHHIPDQLKDKIKLKQYAPFGALAYLPGANYYHAEEMVKILITEMLRNKMGWGWGETTFCWADPM